MPRMRVSPPEAPNVAAKKSLRASNLPQDAARADLRRQGLLEETDRYLSELFSEVREPSSASLRRAEEIAHHVRGAKAGSPKGR